MKNKNLAAMQRAIIMMEEAQKMYAKALENMKSEYVAACVDEVRPESVVVKVEVKAEPLPEPPAVIEVPEEVFTEVVDFNTEYNSVDRTEEIVVANKLCLLAGLEDVKGEYVLVGLKQFYNEGKETPYLSRHHVNVSVVDKYGEEIKSRYIRIESLGDTEMYLRKKDALSWNKEYEPKMVILSLK